MNSSNCIFQLSENVKDRGEPVPRAGENLVELVLLKIVIFFSIIHIFMFSCLHR